MKMDWEQLGKAKFKRSPKEWIGYSEKRGTYQYRLSIFVMADGIRSERHPCYFDLATARLNYKLILLRLYRLKGIEGFGICVNHISNQNWENPIFQDSDTEFRSG
jgi:hypothetical protein